MPAQCVEFLKYLSNQGTNRYLDYAHYFLKEMNDQNLIDVYGISEDIAKILVFFQESINVKNDKRTKLLTSIPNESLIM